MEFHGMPADPGYFYASNQLGAPYGSAPTMQDPNALMYQQTFITPQYGANPGHEHKQ